MKFNQLKFKHLLDRNIVYIMSLFKNTMSTEWREV